MSDDWIGGLTDTIDAWGIVETALTGRGFYSMRGH
jgi:hypothetical protein